MMDLCKVRIWPVGAVCLLAVLAGCDEKQAAVPHQAAPVGVVEIVPSDVDVTTELPGRITAFRVAEVRPQVSGILKKRLFEEGSEVKAGEQLYQIDPERYGASLASAEADLAKANANLKSVQAKASRYFELVKINAVSKQDYDDAVASFDQAKAEVKSAKAALDLAAIDLVYTKVNAPISGRIGKSNVTEGALVTANQDTTLTTVTQLDPIYVDLTQSSVALMQLRREIAAGTVKGEERGLRVSLTVEGDTQSYPLSGNLQFSDVTVDQTTGTVTLRAIFPNPNRDLLPGMFVRARISQGVSKNILTVPQKALIRDASGGASVWVPGPENRAQLQPIQVSQMLGDRWVVTGGLHAGDKVIVDGLQSLRPGVVVAPVPVASATAKLVSR